MLDSIDQILSTDGNTRICDARVSLDRFEEELLWDQFFLEVVAGVKMELAIWKRQISESEIEQLRLILTGDYN